jgi:hypothetical protein
LNIRENGFFVRIGSENDCIKEYEKSEISSNSFNLIVAEIENERTTDLRSPKASFYNRYKHFVCLKI